MDLKQIKELMGAMERAGIKKLTVKYKGGDEVHLERQDEQPPSIPHPMTTFHPPIQAHPPLREPEHPPRPVTAPVEAQPGKFVLAPLVGTFYAASSPDEPSFVKVGDQVNENTVVCIIEAMKVMNEVKAGMKGTVAEVLVENAHPVEFGTKLLRIV